MLLTKTVRREQLVLRVDQPLGAQAKVERDAGGDPHAERDSAPVGGAKAARGFQSVSGRVAVVEDRARPAVALVARHHQRLGGRTPFDHVLKRILIAGGEARALALEEVEKSMVHGDGVLYNLGEGLPVPIARQRVEAGEVRDDRRGLPERADRVLHADAVHAGLASDAGVDHREQRGRHLDVADAAQPGGGGHAREVAYGATADRHDAASAIDPLALQEGEQAAQPGERLGPLPTRDHIDPVLDPRCLDLLRGRVRDRPHTRIRDHHRPRRLEPRHRSAQLLQHPATDVHGVRAAGRVDDQPGHSASRSVATSSGERSASTLWAACS